MNNKHNMNWNMKWNMNMNMDMDMNNITMQIMNMERYMDTNTHMKTDMVIILYG